MRQETNHPFAIFRHVISAIDRFEAQNQSLSFDRLEREMQKTPSYMQHPSYLQESFTRYAKISPERYLQFLRHSHIENMMQTHSMNFDDKNEGTFYHNKHIQKSSLHWCSISSEKFASNKNIAQIYYGWFDSPFGMALILITQNRICGLAFSEEFGREKTLIDAQKRWPKAHFIHDDNAIKAFGDATFFGKNTVELCLIGTEFQIKVWEALLTIPFGFITTYSAIAQKINAPKAVRAVGTALGRNPAAFLVPCHRVVRKSGNLGGYHWGLSLKRAMLADESAAFENQ